MVCCEPLGLQLPHRTLLGVDLPKGLDMVYITRVMEKPGYLSAAILLDLLERVWGQALQEGRVTSLVLWQDCGPHFRCMTMASVMGWLVPTKYRLNTVWNFGLENYMTGIPDGPLGFHSSQTLSIA